jgi:hypothetical protein
MITTSFRPRLAGIAMLATTALLVAASGADARSGSGSGGGHSHGGSMSLASPSRVANPNIKIGHPIIVVTPSHHRHHVHGRFFGDWWYWSSYCAHVPHDAAHRDEWRRCHGDAEVY